MSKIDNTIQEIYYRSVLKRPKDSKLYAETVVSKGEFNNPVIEKIVENLGLKLSSGVGVQASYQEDLLTINMPDKSQFHNPSEYYFLLFHELAHCLVNNDKDYRIATANFIKQYGQFPDTDKILASCKDKESFDKLSPEHQAVAKAYLKEELRVDTVAYSMIQDAGYKITERIKNSLQATAADAKTISEYSGENFLKDLQGETAYANETHILFDKLCSQLQKAEKQLNLTSKEYLQAVENEQKMPHSQEIEK